MNETTKQWRVGAVKKTKHGSYGRSLGSVIVNASSELQARADALPLLQAAYGVKITTEIVCCDVERFEGVQS